MRAVVSSPLLFLLLSLAATVCHGLDPSQCSSAPRASSDYRQCPSSGDVGFFDVVKTKCVETCGKEGGSSCGESCVLQTIIASCEGREEQKKRALRTSCERMDGAKKATGGCEQFVEECVVAAEATSATRDAKATGQNLVQAPVKVVGGLLKSVEEDRSDSEKKVSDEMRRHPLFQRSGRAKRDEPVDTCLVNAKQVDVKYCSNGPMEFLKKVAPLCKKETSSSEAANLCFLRMIKESCLWRDVVKRACNSEAPKILKVTGNCDNWKHDCLKSFDALNPILKCDHGDYDKTYQKIGKCKGPTFVNNAQKQCRQDCIGKQPCINECFLYAISTCSDKQTTIESACPEKAKEFSTNGDCKKLQDECELELFAKSKKFDKCFYPNVPDVSATYIGRLGATFLDEVETECQQKADCFNKAVTKEGEEILMRLACPNATNAFLNEKEPSCDTLAGCRLEYHYQHTTTIKTTTSTRSRSITGKPDHSTKTATTTTATALKKKPKSSEKDRKEAKKDEEDEESSRKKEVITILVWIGGTITACCIFYAILHFCEQRDWCRRR